MSETELSSATEYVRQGNIAFKEKRYDEAAAHFQQALKIDPNFIYAHKSLIAVYRAQNRHSDARTQEQKLKLAGG